MIRTAITLALSGFSLLTQTVKASTTSRDSVLPNPSAPGQLVDLGGYRMHLNCTGAGSPTVVLSAAGVTSIPYIAGSMMPQSQNFEVLGRLSSGESVMGLVHGWKAKIFFIGDANGTEQVPQPFTDNLIAWF
jgi:hypothetical protein